MANPHPTPRVENVQPPPAPAERGNARAVKHGGTAEQRLAPLRERYAEQLAAEYPHLDARRIILMADRLARLESARAWLDQQAGVVRTKRGEVYAVVDRIETWAKTAEQRLAEAEAEARDLDEPTVDALKDRGREIREAAERRRLELEAGEAA